MSTSAGGPRNASEEMLRLALEDAEQFAREVGWVKAKKRRTGEGKS